ncbi:Kelch-like protein 18, partial [Araneus ventricosus]
MQRIKRKFSDISENGDTVMDSSGDGLLRTEDGGEFKVTTRVLAERCPYFEALFHGDFGDGKDVLLKGINTETLEKILVYLYSGNIELNEENASNILIVADYLLIEALVQKSSSFALKEMTPTNCVPLFLAAWGIERLDIFNICHRFMVIHFQEVVSLYEEIGIIPLEALKTVLREKCLNVKDEKTVWNVIVRWIQFDLIDRLQFVPELLKYISFDDADTPLLDDVIDHNHLIKNKFCQELILSQLKDGDYLQKFRLFLKSNTTASRMPKNINVIFYRSTDTYRPDKNIYITFDEQTDYWQKIGSAENVPDYIIHHNRYIYLFTTSIPANFSLAFDLFDQKCLPMTPIYKSRKFYSVINLNGFIYIIGGIDEHSNPIEDIERFDPGTGKWQIITRMIPMSQSKAVDSNGYIYAIGCNEYAIKPKMMVQIFDPESDKWLIVSVPRIFKPEITAIQCRGRLYFLGYYLSFCQIMPGLEEYDPLTDTWFPMPYLPFIYRSAKAFVVKDVLIVHEENKTIDDCAPPVYWLPENRTWNILKTSSPLRKIYLSKICTITDPNVVKV